jgi:N-acetylglucosaminyl-diphospho-decaprenol L-rhamnosyltransferase
MTVHGASWRGSADDTMPRTPRAPGLSAAVSVIIVNYKSYSELGACLASLQSSSGADLEIIVVDHASSAPDLARLQSRYPAIVTSPTAGNPGFSAGVNVGARLASGRHLLILNPDTQLQPGAIDAMMAYLETHPDTAVVGARVEDPGGTVQRSARRFPTMLTGLAGRTSLFTRMWPGNPLSRRDLLADASTATPRDVDWVAGSCMAVKAEAFEKVGGMDEQFFLYWEDADLCKRLREAGWRTAYLPSAVVVHGVGRSRRHARALSVRAFHRSAYLYFAKHRAGRFRAVSLPVAGILLYARMMAKLAVQFVTRRDWSDR